MMFFSSKQKSYVAGIYFPGFLHVKVDGSMVRQTINLFIKATIIGILINVGIEQVPSTSNLTDHSIIIEDETVLFQPPVSNLELDTDDSQ